MIAADSKLPRTLVIVCAILLGGAGRAHAGETATVAQSLFDEGVALMQTGNYEAACPKLRESLRLDAAGGTALNLAYCLEKRGLLASAYTAYKDAQHYASLDHRADREALAKERAQALAAVMPRIAITLETPRQASVDVALDGVVLGEASFQTPIAVDPGKHELTATSPGHVAWSKELDVLASSGVTTIRVPILESSSAPPPQAKAEIQVGPPEYPEHGTATRTAAVALWIGGGAALLGGIGFGVAAITTHGQTGCDPKCKDDHAFALEQDANRYAWISNGAFVGAVVAAGVGTVLYLAFPRTKRVAFETAGLRW